jgi:hypothetical protein
LDKVEYKIRADEIKALIGEGRFAEAVKIADTIDWKRVKSISMLCTISDLYKINRRYTESKDVLLMAYDRHPTSRPIVYSLCELAIKMGEFVQAVEYYKEFVRIAPRDTGRYILQYKLYEAQEVSLEERIAVLEEFKKHDYRERWAYELAYLYHRVGLTTECIEECDEMFLWFGEGRYVMKALELKALHEPLSPEQQDRYSRYKQKSSGAVDASIVSEKDEVGKDEGNTQQIKQPTKEMPPITDAVIKAYNEGGALPEEVEAYNVPEQAPIEAWQTEDAAEAEGAAEENAAPAEDEIVYPHINEIKEPSVDVSAYNTMNLQEALAEGLREIIGEENEDPKAAMQEVFFDTQTVDIPTVPNMGIDIKYGGNGPILGQAKTYDNITDDDITQVVADVENEENEEDKLAATRPFGPAVYEHKPLEDEIPGAVIHPNASYQVPAHLENILSQESDGQISMAVQPEPEVEKQITGQISIEEYMQDWEQFKKNQQEKQFNKVKQMVADQTGNMFADFDVQTKEGLQEKIEKAISDALKKEQYDKASGRGDWSVKREDVINAAVDKVMDGESSQEETSEGGDEQETLESTQGIDKIDVSEADASETVEAATEEEKVAESVSEESDKAEATDPASEKKPEEAAKDPVAKEENVVAPSEEKEPQKKKKVENPEKKHIGNREIEERVRTMTPEEKELFGPYIHHKKSRRQIINAIDNLSMDAFTGNAIVTGEEGAGTVNLAKGLIKAVQSSDSNFSGKVAKITANTLNKKSTSSIFEKLANGALIIQRAADLEPETVSELLKILQEENKGLILVMEDTRDDMDKFLDKNPSLKQSFNVRVDIEALDDDSLVAYAKQYAYEKEYAIDNLGILALHTRISERQTLDHEVTVSEVKDIVDDAIYYAEKRTVGHFVDVIVNKRYDENDMVILREKDFMH